MSINPALAHWLDYLSSSTYREEGKSLLDVLLVRSQLTRKQLITESCSVYRQLAQEIRGTLPTYEASTGSNAADNIVPLQAYSVDKRTFNLWVSF